MLLKENKKRKKVFESLSWEVKGQELQFMATDNILRSKQFLSD